MSDETTPHATGKQRDILDNSVSNLVVQGSRKTVLPLIEKSEMNRPRLIFCDLSTWFLNVNIKIRTLSENITSYELLSDQINMIQSDDSDFWTEQASFFATYFRILAEDGFLAIKVNGSIKSRIKVLLDQICGYDRFVNEIILDSPFMISYAPDLEIFERTDYILLYNRGTKPRVNPVWNDKTGGGYWHSFVSKGQGKPKTFIFKKNEEVVLSPPPGTHWKLRQEEIVKLCQEGLIRLNSKGNPEYWVPEKKGLIIDTNWLDISSAEKDLTTPQTLHTRLLNLLLTEGDLFLTFSPERGSSLLVAEDLKLKWIAIEENVQNIPSLIDHLTTNLSSPPIHLIVDPGSPFQELPTFYDSKTAVGLDFLSKIPSLEEILSIHIKEKKDFFPFEKYGTLDKRWTNMLFHGDCGAILPHLAKRRLKEKIKLIYIDPPFFTGIHEHIVVPVGGDNTQFEALAFHNAIEEHNLVETFTQWFAQRVRLMVDLLREDGVIFVRFDYHVGHYARLILDQIFGPGTFIGEFLVRRMKKNLSRRQAQGQKHLINHNDFLFAYRKNGRSSMNLMSIQKKKRKGQDLAEREYPNDTVWLDIAGYQKAKKTLYPTENSETLLSRVINTASSKGDLIADFFCGSGTTIAVAEKLGRRWIAADLSHYSIQQTRKRLFEIPNLNPFTLYVSPGNQSEARLEDQESDSQSVQLTPILEENRILIGLTNFKPRKKLDFVHKNNYQDLIDSWSIDWDYKSDVFRLGWISCRMLKGKRVVSPIETQAEHVYSKGGLYVIKVNIVDVFADKYTITLDLQVGGLSFRNSD